MNNSSSRLQLLECISVPRLWQVRKKINETKKTVALVEARNCLDCVHYEHSLCRLCVCVRVSE